MLRYSTVNKVRSLSAVLRGETAMPVRSSRWMSSGACKTALPATRKVLTTLAPFLKPVKQSFVFESKNSKFNNTNNSQQSK